MANTVAYPDTALEKFIGIDSSEDPTAFFRLLDKKKSVSDWAVDLLQVKITSKQYMTIQGEPFSVPSSGRSC